ncbi:MAG: hypothetical protein ABSE84_28445, partial [Isosphaeraceae bacterium]
MRAVKPRAVLARLLAAGIEVTVESGAGAAALNADQAYVDAGAKVAADWAATIAGADVICKVQAPTPEEANRLAEGSALVCLLQPAANLQSLADQVLLQCYSPAAVLINNKGDILYISGRTGKYLEPAAGKTNWNIFAMAREGLRHELTGALQKALRQKGAATLRNVVVRTNGGTQAVDLTVQPLEEPEELRGMVMIVFTDVATPPETKPAGKTGRGPARSARLVEQEQEIEQLRQELRTTREEMQTSQEELKSTNEELQSTNE